MSTAAVLHPTESIPAQHRNSGQWTTTRIPPSNSTLPNRSGVYHARPKGWQTDPEREVWTLADLELDEHVNRDQITKQLKESLELTLSQARTLTGTLKKRDGRVQIVKTRDSAAPFIVKYSDEHNIKISIDDQAAEFPPALVREAASLDEMGDLHTNTVTSSCPASVFQTTWIPGGMILTTSFHHYCIDGGGFQAFLKEWRDNALSLATGLNRGRLNGKPVPKEHQLDAPPPPPPMVLPLVRRGEPLLSVVVQLSQANADRLKAAAQPATGFVSTYDAVTALLWRAHTRARLSICNPEPGEFSPHGTAVDLRKRFTPPLPAQLQANATTAILTGRPVQDLATLIRRSHTGATEQAALGKANMVAALKDKSRATWDLDEAVPRFSTAMSDRRNAGWYDMDFGFGPPVALRNVNQPVERTMMRMLPARPGRDGVEVQVPVEVACLDSFVRDVELLRYAEVACT
ncbi:Uu.00g049140.m01.CDS01 [Anthostomella pinea]|uniref:Uu.00g049140.m01.CDS01 n=1 Tax=Anthostomella pinea TaxID=933095 RepID=A0AAI8VCV4_9PEZI|nr:Uu.00g049140.m01.CDS01 [Anthostomella pinea]